MAAINVVHLAPHYGGGVGSVIRSLIEKQTEYKISHELVALESINSPMLTWCENHYVATLQHGLEQSSKLSARLAEADIVHIHWWNHPLLMQWMVSCSASPFRSVLWTHVNGMHAPQAFFKELFSFSDITALATPFSLESLVIPQGGADVRVMQSMSEVTISPQSDVKRSEGVNIGYIGTVDYIKMHPQFIRLCLDAKINDVRFTVCGGPYEKLVRQQIAELGAEASFDIRGPVNNVSEVLSELDLFGYPLNPKHYGSGEQVLLEAMGAGVVPVVLDTGCERFIIHDGKDGIIASSCEEYSQALNYLANNPALRRTMSLAARQRAKFLSQEKYWEAWLQLYEELLTRSKRVHHLKLSKSYNSLTQGGALLLQAYQDTSFDSVFMNALADLAESNQLIDSVPWSMQSATRGTPKHYLSYFPEDKDLSRICKKFAAFKVLE